VLALIPVPGALIGLAATVVGLGALAVELWRAGRPGAPRRGPRRRLRPRPHQPPDGESLRPLWTMTQAEHHESRHKPPTRSRHPAARSAHTQAQLGELRAVRRNPRDATDALRCSAPARDQSRRVPNGVPNRAKPSSSHRNGRRDLERIRRQRHPLRVPAKPCTPVRFRSSPWLCSTGRAALHDERLEVGFSSAGRGKTQRQTRL
jgi:hypothetical protein